jgi:hypothetical protein
MENEAIVVQTGCVLPDGEKNEYVSSHPTPGDLSPKFTRA